jgi:hypothetical protein
MKGKEAQFKRSLSHDAPLCSLILFPPAVSQSRRSSFFGQKSGLDNISQIKVLGQAGIGQKRDTSVLDE